MFNFLPILRRELLVQARRRTTYRARLGVAAFGLCACLILLVDSRVGRAGGQGLFNALVGSMLVLSVAACLIAADAFSRETREGTLGLLLMTHVRPFDLVAGKLAALGLGVVCALITLAPVMSLPLLLGGVTGGEVLRKALALLNLLVLSVALGLLGSTTDERLTITTRRTTLLMIGLLALPLWFWHFTAQPWKSLGLLSPLVAVLTGSDAAYSSRGLAGNYWWCLGVGTAEIAVLLALTASRLSLALEPVKTKMPKREPPLSAEAVEQKQTRWLHRREKHDPVEWLVGQQAGVRAAFWAAAVLTAVLQPWLLPLSGLLRSPGGIFLWYWMPSFTFTLASSILLAWGVTRFMAQTQRSGEYELLVTTPVGAREMIPGQWRALKKLLRGPVALMLLPLVLQWLSWWGFSSRLSVGFYYPHFFVFFGVANLICSIAALCWVGLLCGTHGCKQLISIVWTVGLAVALPQFLGFFLRGVPGAFLGFSIGGTMLTRSFVSALLILYYLLLIRSVRRKLAVAVPGCDGRRTLGQRSHPGVLTPANNKQNS